MDAKNCSASGEGLLAATAGVEASFRVMCRSTQGELMDLPDDGRELTIKFTEKGREQAGTHAPSSKGTFDAVYTPTVAGVCPVSVLYKGEHIRGSPFEVTVEAGELHAACLFACCDGGLGERAGGGVALVVCGLGADVERSCQGLCVGLCFGCPENAIGR